MSDAFDDDAIAAIDGESNAGTSNGANPPVTLPAATAKPAASVVPPGTRLVSPFDLYLEREPGGTDFFDGEFVHFNGQTGAWTRGAKKNPIGSTVMFLSNMREIAIGWVKVVDSRIVDRQIGWVKDGYERPPREELDDRDDRRWPFNNRDEQEDPWKMTSYLPMRCLEDGEPVVFGPFAPTQLAAIKNLVQVFQRVNRGGKDPVFLLQSESFKNRSGGTTYKPVFKIVRWEFWEPDKPAPPMTPIAVPIAPPAKPATAKLAAPARKRAVGGNTDDETIPF